MSRGTYPRGKFIVIPKAAAYDVRLTDGALRVLMILQDHSSGPDDRMFPSVRRLAELGGMSDRHARRALRLLEGCGHIATTPRIRAGRGKTTNNYRVIFANDQATGRADMDVPPGGRPGGHEPGAERTNSTGRADMDVMSHDQNPVELDSGDQNARARAREGASRARAAKRRRRRPAGRLLRPVVLACPFRPRGHRQDHRRCGAGRSPALGRDV